MKTEKILDQEMFKNLSEEEKKLALSILEQYENKGTSDTYEYLLKEHYDEIPVDIVTFMHDRKYLGNGLYDNGRFTVFPYWEETLKNFFQILLLLLTIL